MATIVILDDSPTNRSIYARLAMMVEDSITTEVFADPMDALEWLETNRADLVITDFKMPGMDGAAFTRYLRAIPAMALTPILVVTAYDDRSFRVRALDAGATDFLQSPIDHFEFVTRARNLLALGQRQQAQDALAPTRTGPNALGSSGLGPSGLGPSGPDPAGPASLALPLVMPPAAGEAARPQGLTVLARILDALPAMISATDQAGAYVYANAAFAAAFGMRPSEVLGSTAPALFGSGWNALEREKDRLVFETGEPLAPYQESLAWPGGARSLALTTKTPLRDRMGGVVAVLTTSFMLPQDLGGLPPQATDP